MSNSSLVTYIDFSPHHSRRTGKISKITIHHAAGRGSVEDIGRLFRTNPASANYGIGSDGRIALYVEEDCRAWTSSNSANDNVAVTIEVANCGTPDDGHPDWPVSDKAYAALLDLCEDICRRNGIERLNYTGDASGNLTMHCFFAATACPGPYLKARFPAIAAEVNRRLNVSEQPPAQAAPLLTGDAAEGEAIYRKLSAYLQTLPVSDYAEAASRHGIASGVFLDGDNDGLVDLPRGIVTRQDLAVVLDRLKLLGGG